MRRLLLLLPAVGMVAGLILATSSAARRPHASGGPDPATQEAAASNVSAAIAVADPAPHAARVAPSVELAQRPASAIPPGSASMVLTIDPETGQPALPESQLHRALTISELQALARVEAEGLVTIKNADGSETLNHEGRFADHSIARVGPDGKPIFECVQGEGPLEHALRGPLPAKPAAEDR